MQTNKRIVMCEQKNISIYIFPKKSPYLCVLNLLVHHREVITRYYLCKLYCNSNNSSNNSIVKNKNKKNNDYSNNLIYKNKYIFMNVMILFIRPYRMLFYNLFTNS